MSAFCTRTRNPGGKRMDMFMDKLAQKLTAQEIIRANTAADVEELNKLKNQIAEYNECLAKLQKLIDDGAGKLAEIRENDVQVSRLVKQGVDGTLALRREVDGLKAVLEKLSEQCENMDKSFTWKTDTSVKSLGNKIDRLYTQMEDQNRGRYWRSWMRWRRMYIRSASRYTAMFRQWWWKRPASRPRG